MINQINNLKKRKKKKFSIIKNIKYYSDNYKNLIQYLIKTGKKHKIENFFRKILWDHTSKINFPLENIIPVLKNTTPSLSTKTKRQGSRNVFLPITIKRSRGKYLSANWLVSCAKERNNFKLYKNLLEEFNESFLKKSFSVKKRNDLHKLAESSLVNYKKKLF